MVIINKMQNRILILSSFLIIEKAKMNLRPKNVWDLGESVSSPKTEICFSELRENFTGKASVINL